MANPDPIADNMTEQTIIALTNGSADDSTRDHATAALLSSVQKLITKTDEIEKNLWKPEELERVIDARHHQLCQACPSRVYIDSLRKQAQAGGAKKFTGWFSLLSNPTTVMIIVLSALSLMMGLALVHIAAGKEGFHDITDAVHLTTEEVK